MALSAATVWEVRASGGSSDSNGGGFVAGASGTDFSQQNAAQSSGTDLVVDATVNTKVTSASHNFVAADVGNIIQITAGAGWTTGFYQVVSVAANAATLDRSPAATSTTGGTWALGGALATLAKLAGAMVASNKAYVTGAFTSTANTTFAQSLTPASAAPPTRIIGYGSVRGDSGTATLTLQTNANLYGLRADGVGVSFRQIAVDCASLGNSVGIYLAGGSNTARNCKVANFTAFGFWLNTNIASVVECEATGGGAAANGAIYLGGLSQLARGCFVHDNACPGIVATVQGEMIEGNLVANNSGASSDGIRLIGGAYATGNTCHNNGRDGVRVTVDTQHTFVCLKNTLTNNGGYGLTANASGAIAASMDFDGNAYFSNTSGARNNADSTAGIYGVTPYTNVRDVTLSGSPYVGPTTGSTANFALNNTAGAGAACRAVGTPTVWPGNTGTTGYPDMGAVQHQDSGSGGLIGAGSLQGGMQ